MDNIIHDYTQEFLFERMYESINLIPSRTFFTQRLSVCMTILLIMTYITKPFDKFDHLSGMYVVLVENNGTAMSYVH